MTSAQLTKNPEVEPDFDNNWLQTDSGLVLGEAGTAKGLAGTRDPNNATFEEVCISEGRMGRVVFGISRSHLDKDRTNSGGP